MPFLPPNQQRLQCLCLQGFDAVCWAAGRASGLQKTEWWGAGVVICQERGADLHMAQPMPLPLTISCFSKIQIGFTFLVLARPGSAICIYTPGNPVHNIKIFTNIYKCADKQ